jgi:hypothetical protein
MSTDGWLPIRTKGRPTTVSNARYEAKLATCAADIEKIRSRLEFAPSSRGWCYVLEGEGLITKGQFGPAQDIINDLRKSGLLLSTSAARISGAPPTGSSMWMATSPTRSMLGSTA